MTYAGPKEHELAEFLCRTIGADTIALEKACRLFLEVKAEIIAAAKAEAKAEIYASTQAHLKAKYTETGE